MTSIEIQRLRALFIEAMTLSSSHNDKRRKDYNDAIFDATTGEAIWNDMDIEMVLDKFDKSTRRMNNG